MSDPAGRQPSAAPWHVAVALALLSSAFGSGCGHAAVVVPTPAVEAAGDAAVAQVAASLPWPSRAGPTGRSSAPGTGVSRFALLLIDPAAVATQHPSEAERRTSFATLLTSPADLVRGWIAGPRRALADGVPDVELDDVVVTERPFDLQHASDQATDSNPGIRPRLVATASQRFATSDTIGEVSVSLLVHRHSLEPVVRVVVRESAR